MKWFDNESIKQELADSPERTQWVQDEAERLLPDLLPKLPAELRSKDRLGPMNIEALEGAEGLYCWMVPLDGSNVQGKILGIHHRVKLIDPNGNIFFDGLWGETTETLIRAHFRFFIWLEPPKRKTF